MKIGLIFLGTLLFTLNSLAQFDFKGIGGGMSMGSKSSISKSGNGKLGFGLNINAYAQVIKRFDTEVNLNYYFQSNATFYNYQLITINLNGRYNFFQKNRLTTYGLFGLNFNIIDKQVPYLNNGTILMGGYDKSGRALGFNIGAGLNYEINNKFDLTTQIGYTLGKVSQFFLNFGGAYKF